MLAREATCGTVSFHNAKGTRLRTLCLGRMPESGKVALKVQLASEVAQIKQLRPEIRVVAIADGAADNWTFLDSLSPATQVVDFWHACEHLRTASDHAVAPDWFERYRHILRHDPRGVDKAIRRCPTFMTEQSRAGPTSTGNSASSASTAIDSGVVEAANKTLVTQRMKRSGMRWRIAGGQAVLSFRALIKSGRFHRAWAALTGATHTPVNDNITPTPQWPSLPDLNEQSSTRSLPYEARTLLERNLLLHHPPERHRIAPVRGRVNRSSVDRKPGNPCHIQLAPHEPFLRKAAGLSGGTAGFRRSPVGGKPVPADGIRDTTSPFCFFGIRFANIAYCLNANQGQFDACALWRFSSARHRTGHHPVQEAP